MVDLARLPGWMLTDMAARHEAEMQAALGAARAQLFAELETVKAELEPAILELSKKLAAATAEADKLRDRYVAACCARDRIAREQFQVSHRLDRLTASLHRRLCETAPPQIDALVERLRERRKQVGSQSIEAEFDEKDDGFSFRKVFKGDNSKAIAAAVERLDDAIRAAEALKTRPTADLAAELAEIGKAALR